MRQHWARPPAHPFPAPPSPPALRCGCSLWALRTSRFFLLAEEELLRVRPDLRRRAGAHVLCDRLDVLPPVPLHGFHEEAVLLGGPVPRLRSAGVGASASGGEAGAVGDERPGDGCGACS